MTHVHAATNNVSLLNSGPLDQLSSILDISCKDLIPSAVEIAASKEQVRKFYEDREQEQRIRNNIPTRGCVGWS